MRNSDSYGNDNRQGLKKIAKIDAARNTPFSMGYQIALNQARWLKLVCFGQLGVIVLLGLSIVMLLPLKTIEIRYVEFTNARDNFFKVYGANMSKSDRAILLRKAFRNYVYNAHTVDQVSAIPRFREVRAMSSDTVFQQQKETFIKLRRKLDGGIRTIRILYDQVLDKDLHEVEFEAVDIDKSGAERARDIWVVKIRYKLLEDNTVNSADELLNPLGIRVVGYNFTQKQKDNHNVNKNKNDALESAFDHNL